MRRLSLVLSLHSPLVDAALSSAPSSNLLADSLPVVEVSLSAPSQPLPELSAEIGALDRKREVFEDEMVSKFEHQAQATLQEVRSKVEAVVSRFVQTLDDPAWKDALVRVSPGRDRLGFLQSSNQVSAGQRASLSFLEKPIEPKARVSTFMVHVWNAAPLDYSVIQHVKEMERDFASSEQRMFDELIGSLRGLPSQVAGDVEAELNREAGSMMMGHSSLPTLIQRGRPIAGAGAAAASGASLLSLARRATTQGRQQQHAQEQQHQQQFLQRQEAQHLQQQQGQASAMPSNIRVVPSGVSYPTVQSMVDAMLKRRTAAETLAMRQMEMMHVQAVQSANEIAKDALTAAVQRVAQHLKQRL